MAESAKLGGNLHVRDLVEIKKDGTVIGDITTAQISIEDGAYLKGKIEVDRGNRLMAKGLERAGVPVATNPI